jgi:magnesium transporter
MDLALPPIVRFHELHTPYADSRLAFEPALSFHQQTTAQEAIDALRQLDPQASNVYYLFVTDSQERLVGVVNLHQLLCAAPGARLFEFMERQQITLSHRATLEEQANLMSETGLLALPVVDDQGRLVGAMDSSDLIRTMRDESTAEMYHLAGIQKSENVAQPTASSASYRSAWLLANLGVALLLAWFISGFAQVITSAVVLVALLPLVLRPAQHAAMQGATMTVRSLALGQITLHNSRAMLSREMLGGLFNGLVLGGVASLVGWLWQGSMLLGMLVGLAVLVNLVLAVLAGVGVPLLCKAWNIDPTRMSGLAVTTITDICGLACLLGMGALALSAGYL